MQQARPCYLTPPVHQHKHLLKCRAEAATLNGDAAQGRAAEAISCYEHVALLQPESPEAHANLASAYKDAARQDTAIQRYQQVRTRCWLVYVI